MMPRYGRYPRYQTISRSAARELILSHRLNGCGRMFSVSFRRRTESKDGRRKSGQQEIMQLRFNVRKHLASMRDCENFDGTIDSRGRAAYDRCSKNVFCAWCTKRKYAVNTKYTDSGCGYKSIPFESITWLQLDGTVYKVGAAPRPQH